MDFLERVLGEMEQGVRGLGPDDQGLRDAFSRMAKIMARLGKWEAPKVAPVVAAKGN
jgi:hypothetical protein